jgi:Domain of unknown function (DUF4328)
MRGYVSARSRAQLVDVLLAAQVAILALRTVGGLWTACVPHGELSSMITRGAAISAPFLLVLFIAAAVALLLWLDRAARNLSALGAAGALAPETVVGVFFAPVVNLIAIPWVVRNVWLASDPTPPPAARVRRLLVGWWPTLLLAGLFEWPPFIANGLLLLSARCLLAIVRDVQHRQDEQWLDSERQAAVPQPTADFLR